MAEPVQAEHFGIEITDDGDAALFGPDGDQIATFYGHVANGWEADQHAKLFVAALVMSGARIHD